MNIGKKDFCRYDEIQDLGRGVPWVQMGLNKRSSTRGPGRRRQEEPSRGEDIQGKQTGVMMHLKMEEGATSQGMQVTSRAKNSRKHVSPLEPPQEHSSDIADFRPMRPTLR